MARGAQEEGWWVSGFAWLALSYFVVSPFSDCFWGFERQRPIRTVTEMWLAEAALTCGCPMAQVLLQTLP